MPEYIVDLETSADTSIAGVFLPWDKDAEITLSGMWGKDSGYVEEKELTLEPATYVGHNIKYDLIWLKHFGFDIRSSKYKDTLLREYLVQGGERARLGLGETAQRYGLQGKIDLISSFFKAGAKSSDIPHSWLSRYLRADVSTTALLYHAQVKNTNLMQQKELAIFSEALIPVLADMQYSGAKICTDKLAEVRKELESMLSDKEFELYSALETVLNEHYDDVVFDKEKKTKLIDSSRMAEVVYGIRVIKEHQKDFGKWAQYFRPWKTGAQKEIDAAIEKWCEKLPYGANVKPKASWMQSAQVQKSTYVGKTGFLSNSKILKAFLDVGEPTKKQKRLVEAFLEYNKVKTWISGCLGQIEGNIFADGFVHGDFKQTGTVTQRLSANHPNMQNWPARDKTFKLKKVIVSRYDSGLILSADYGQLEFRVVGLLANDTQLLEDVASGFDIHTHTAKLAFGAKFEEASDENKKAMRGMAKTLTFAFQYGAVPKTKTQQAIFDAFYGKYYRVAAWQERVVAEILRHKKYTCPFTGKIFAFPYANTHNINRWSTKAKNYPVQYLSAIITQAAMLGVWEDLEEHDDDIKLIMQTHDSISLDTKREKLDIAANILHKNMTGVTAIFEKYFKKALNVELAIDMEYGEDYTCDKSYKF